jgi:hypothetical protein
MSLFTFRTFNLINAFLTFQIRNSAMIVDLVWSSKFIIAKAEITIPQLPAPNHKVIDMNK